MPRPRQQRKVQVPPKLKGFMPVGNYQGVSDQVLLDIEEYESIRLLDYEGLSQAEAALLMEVSRPTLTRVYESARRKIAKAFTEALPVMIGGGNVTFNGNWFICKSCGSRYNSYGSKVNVDCPLCGCQENNNLNPEQS